MVEKVIPVVFFGCVFMWQHPRVSWVCPMCDTHLDQLEQHVQVRRMMVARPEIRLVPAHRLDFPLPQVTVLHSQQLEDLLVLGLVQKFC